MRSEGGSRRRCASLRFAKPSRCGHPDQNALIADVRALLSQHERSEVMVQAGLHVPGADPSIDRALALQPKLDAFFGSVEHDRAAASFAALEILLGDPRRGRETSDLVDLVNRRS